MKYEDRSCAIGKGWANLETHKTVDGSWTVGVVITPHGFVDVYMQEDYTRFDLVHKKRLYMRYYEISMTRRTLVYFAKRFAKEIMNRKG